MTADGTKKAVCRGFTGILKESPLATSVDPKSFFMMLNTNYSALARDGEIDLGPISEALRSAASQDALLPVLAKFEQKASELGLVAKLPPALEGMDDEARAQLVATYDAQRGLIAPPAPSSDDADPEKTDLERRVVNAFVQGFRRSPLGQRLDPSQLTYFLGGQVDALLEAQTLRIEPVVDALRQQGVTDPDIYVGLAMAGDKLKSVGVELVEPTLDVRPEMKPQLVRRALSRQAPARARSSTNERQKADEERRKGLEDFELPSRRSPPGRAKLIRVGVLAVILIGLGGVALMSRDDRPLATGPFSDSVPLASAQLVDGAFTGTIDWAEWSELPADEQRARLEAFEEKLRDRGWFIDFQLRGPNDDVLALPIEGRVRTSPKLFSDYEPRGPGSPSPAPATAPEPVDDGSTESSD